MNPKDSVVDAFERATYRKVSLRLLPFLFLCYVLAYLDRVNVGFAKLQMSADLGFSDAVYGAGAGIFFIGYFFLEVPSNVILSRVGARIWIARIMVSWGLIAMGTMFVSSERAFYILRFLLGVAEAGFFPGIILYFTYWYPHAYRARMIAWFMTAIPLAGIVGGPLSGWILKALDGVATLRGWQWMFLIEGALPVVMGLWVLRFLDDSPAQAKWLAADERDLLLTRLQRDATEKPAGGSVWEAFRSVKVWLLGAVYFGMVMGLYGISFWLPQIIKDTLTADPFRIGLISSIPWCVAAFAMVAYGYHSDASGERRWHVALACLLAAGAFAASALPGLGGWTGILMLSLATAGIMAALSCFWTLPTGMLHGTAAAAGIAWINSFGNLAGYVSPGLVGMIRDAAGKDMTLALYLLAGSLAAAGALTLYVARREDGIPVPGK
ncbi:MAG: MFS transporter [Sulfuricella sp.]|nr:MFS transporter [Sulfuricella sp.]